MTKYVRNLCFLLFVAFLLLFTPQCTANHVRPMDEIIREIVHTYYRNPLSSDDKLNALFQELEHVNLSTANSWKEIIAYWKYTDRNMAINSSAIPNDLDNTDQLCIVILGFELSHDGSMKDELIGRLQTALTCANQYPSAYVLCTGGGTASGNRDATEAEKMAQWLEKNGVSSNRILVENQSLTTTQNAEYSCKLLCDKAPQVSSVILVSSDYHIPWGAVLLQTSFILCGRELRVVSNAAYEVPSHPDYPIRKYQLNGIMDIAKLSGK